MAVQGRAVVGTAPKTIAHPTALKLLICDTDPRTAQSFRPHPVTVTTAKTAARATPLLTDVDALVVEFGLAGAPALIDAAVTAHVPILVVSSLPAETYLPLAYERGADDWIAKPVRPREIIARVRAIQRRQRWSAEGTRRLALAWGGIVLERSVPRRVIIGSFSTHLSPTDARVLAVLLRAQDKGVTAATIEDLFRHCEAPDVVRYTSIRDLRKRLRPLGRTVIETLRSQGYRLRAVPETTATAG